MLLVSFLRHVGPCLLLRETILRTAPDRIPSSGEGVELNALKAKNLELVGCQVKRKELVSLRFLSGIWALTVRTATDVHGTCHKKNYNIYIYIYVYCVY